MFSHHEDYKQETAPDSSVVPCAAGSGTQEVPTPVPAGPKVSLKRALKKALHCCSTKTIDSPAAGSVALSGGSAAPTQTAGSRRAPGRPRGSPFARLGRFFCMG